MNSAMKYEELEALNRVILATREPGARSELVPILNALLPTQRYLIISSDPSADTNKDRPLLDKHSAFEERILALLFYGSDGPSSVTRIKSFYQEYKSLFLRYFYWTHYSKVYAQGNPGSFWAKRFLLREIELFEPKVIVIFGGLVTRFLFGTGNFHEKVNKILLWDDIPTICCLHPSRDWNLRKRDDFDFDATWRLIRKTCRYSPDDTAQLRELGRKTSKIVVTIKSAEK